MIVALSLEEVTRRICLYDDTDAYKQLFLYYQPKLLRFSISILHNKESAEEVVSDVFLKIWTNRKSLMQIKNLHLYLYVSTKNLSLNRLEKQERERAFSLDEVVVEFTSMYYDPEQLMITSEMYQRIQNAIQQLPPKCQLIFKLIKEDGLSYKEVAELLGLSVKTIENQMGIAIKKMGKAIPFEIHKTITL
jgi:RNA polymerase sigma-70 factor (ECF subfamily)